MNLSRPPISTWFGLAIGAQQAWFSMDAEKEDGWVKTIVNIFLIRSHGRIKGEDIESIDYHTE